MRRKKKEFENLTEDEQQQVELEKCKVQIFQAKNNIEENIIRIGQYLIIAKSWVKHGEWENWLETNVQYTKMTASRYMKAYKLVENVKEELSYNLQKLGGTKIIELSALKVKQVEEIISKENVEEMSVRELKEFVKELKQTTKKSKPKSNIDVTFEEQTENQPPTPISTDIVIHSDTKEVFAKLCILNAELRNRVNSDEDLETTLVAMYNAKEITHQEFIDVVAQNKLKLPIFFYKDDLDDYIDRTDFYSDYEHWGDKDKYYSLFLKELKWKEIISCCDETDEDLVDYININHVDNGIYQIAEGHNSYGDRFICIYKDYKPLGTFQDGDWDNISTLSTYDRVNVPVECLDKLKELYEQLEQQIMAYDKRSSERFSKRQKEQEKRKKQKEKFDEAFDDWYKNYQPYSMGKYRFSDIWNENGDIKNFKLWREMTDFVNAEKRKKYDGWKNYDFGNLFGNNTPAIKEEDKGIYKKFYRKLAMEFHPDKCGDNGHAMQLANNLKEQWGI